MSRISGIKVESVKSSLQNFFDDYRQQSGVHGASRSYLKRSLDLALGSDIANSVLQQHLWRCDPSEDGPPAVGLRRSGWPSASATSTCGCRRCSSLSCRRRLAGGVVGALPEGGRDLVLLSMARLSEVDRDLLVELDELVDRCLGGLGLQSTSVEGVQPGGRDSQPPAGQPCPDGRAPARARCRRS